jgi:hypothetical protein
VGQPAASVWEPAAQAIAGQAIAGQEHVGACHEHLLSPPRAHFAPITVPPSQMGCAKGGGGPHSFCVQIGAGLHWQSWQPFASVTLPHWQKMLQMGPQAGAPAEPVEPEPALPPFPPAPATPPVPAAPVVPATPFVPAAPVVPATPVVPAAPVVPALPVTPASAPASSVKPIEPQPTAASTKKHERDTN